MEKKLLKVYLNLFLVFTFITSALFVYDIISKLDLPSGIISAVVNYGYFIIHIASYVAMFHFQDMLIFTSKEEK